MLLVSVALLLVLIVTISFIVLPQIYTLERFESNNTIVYTDNRLNYDKWIRQIGKNQWQPQSVPLTSMDAMYKYIDNSKSFPKNILPSTSSVAWIASELEYNQFIRQTGEKKVLASTDAYFVAIGIPEKMYYIECMYEFKGKKIGYMDRMDRHFITTVLLAYRIPKEQVEMVEVPMTEWERLGKYMDAQKIDMIVAHFVQDSYFRLFLKNQYIAVSGWGNIDINRLAVFNPFLSKTELDLKGLFMGGDRNNQALVMDREKNGPVIKMSINMYALTNVQIPQVTEEFITRLEISDDMYDPSFRCYGDDNIEQKALCVSPFNAQGDVKRVPTKWDRPCVQDSDCPFFQANKRYPNKRGGCLKGGICEMPTGVLRTAFRTYNAENEYSPFCYQCSDPADKQCCKNQPSPDYVFANDLQERTKAGLPTFVSVF